MFFEFFKEGAITADPNNIVPGSIFVDVSKSRKNSIVYEAYNKGASLIFTSKNVSDPELPVIKVKEANDTLFLLLDKYYNKLQHKMKLIGIGGNNQKDVVADIVNQIFLFNLIEYIDKKEISRFKTSNSSDLEKLFINMQHMLEIGIDKMPVLLDYMSKEKEKISSLSLDFGILTNVEYSDIYNNTSSQLLTLLEIYNNVPAGKPILVNIDEPLSLDFVSHNKSAILITYGLNKKASVTATSIDLNEFISFNYCLQRTIITESGNIIEPFEMPIELRLTGEDSVYVALAAITCGLYYDYDILYIKKILKDYHGLERRFQTIHQSIFTIIDNYCCLPSDFNMAFKMVQTLNYNKLRPVISICRGVDPSYYEHSVNIIVEWSKILNLDEVIITESFEDNDDYNLIPHRILRTIKRIFADNNITFKHYKTFKASMEYATKYAEKNDIVLLLGGKEMDIPLDIYRRKMKLN